MELSLLAPVSWQKLVIRIGVALLVGGILGFDREAKRKAAGLRTYMLVSLGSAFFVLIPIQLGAAYKSVDALSRVMQGLIAGIGFIGGGVILHQSNEQNGTPVIKGLTSAAAIWVAAGLGTAAGCGLWELALMGAGISLFVLRVVKWLERT